ncbi:MAG: hypothetical protein QGH66_07205 [Dehalococcoidia bacterium]|nr:hypothetical protein [Dehalococcoidia bacterium]
MAKMHGKPCELFLNIAMGRVGNIAFELHYLGFYVDDTEAAMARLKEKSAAVLQRGCTQRRGFVYMDSSRVGDATLKLIARR